MITKFQLMNARDVCEWNPTLNRPAYLNDEEHGLAEVLVGHDGIWRVCESCSQLPKFKKYKVRKPIIRKGN